MKQVTLPLPRMIGLTGILCLQGLCAAFFLFDSLSESAMSATSNSGIWSNMFEALVTLALIVGLCLTVLEIRRILGRQGKIERQLRVSSAAFMDLLSEYFDDWDLTPSERDVALLAIKGFSIRDMARLRDTKEGTIKAQSNAIYRKAGVSGRTQLLSLFIEELLADAATPKSAE